MKRDTIVTIVAGVVFIGGLTFFFWIRNAAQNIHKQRELEASFVQSSRPIDPAFTPQPLDSSPFEATIEVSPADEEKIITRLYYNGNGTLRVEIKQDGGLVEYYLTPGGNILCDGLSCFRTPSSDENEPLFDISSFVYDKERTRALGEGLVIAGEVPCGATTCVQWKPPSVVDAEFTVLIEKETDRLIRTEGFEEEALVVTRYEHKDVRVVLPLNVEEVEELDEELVPPQTWSLPI